MRMRMCMCVPRANGSLRRARQVWLNDGWKRWMTWRAPEQPPVPEAALIAFADVLVTTDELNMERDARGARCAMPRSARAGKTQDRPPSETDPHTDALAGRASLTQVWSISEPGTGRRRWCNSGVNRC